MNARLPTTALPLPTRHTQDTRLLRIHTALGADVFVVETFAGREALDEGFRFEVDVLSTDAHGAGVLFQVGAIVITPTPLQKWASRSYFGKGSDKFPKGDWKAEKDALLEAVGTGTQEAHKTEPAKPESTPDFELAGP